MIPIKSITNLDDHNLVPDGCIDKLVEVENEFDVSITDEMLNLIKTGNEAIYKQFMPDVNELVILPNEVNDPTGDDVKSVVKGLVHRYPDRVLLMPLSVCPIYCRFCFRRSKLGKQKALTKIELENCYYYIKNNKNVSEVILSGGDPLFLKPKSLKAILVNLFSIPHVEVVRIHTRVPIVAPQLINDDMLNALNVLDLENFNSDVNKALFIALHTNHASEFTINARASIKKLQKLLIPIVSQTVLLKDINDNFEALSSLMKTIVKNGIKPYYIHQLDLAKGINHFRVDIKKGQELMKELRANLSGLCQPTYVLDSPKATGKVPLI